MQIHTKRVPHTEFTYEILDSHNYAVSHTNLTELNHFVFKTQDLNANSYKSDANSYKNSSRTEFICEFLDQAPGPNSAPRFSCENCNFTWLFRTNVPFCIQFISNSRISHSKTKIWMRIHTNLMRIHTISSSRIELPPVIILMVHLNFFPSSPVVSIPCAAATLRCCFKVGLAIFKNFQYLDFIWFPSRAIAPWNLA